MEPGVRAQAQEFSQGQDHRPADDAPAAVFASQRAALGVAQATHGDRDQQQDVAAAQPPGALDQRSR
jgi:hypothetical protein